MNKLNGIELTGLVSVNAVEILPCHKNNYLNTFGDVERNVKFNGRINLACSIPHADKDELVEKLNKLEVALKDGVLEIGPKAYNVSVLSELEQGTDFSNFELVFSWDGTYVENGVLQDVSI